MDINCNFSESDIAILITIPQKATANYMATSGFDIQFIGFLHVVPVLYWSIKYM